MRVPPCVLTVEKPVFLNTPNQTQGEETTLPFLQDAPKAKILKGVHLILCFFEYLKIYSGLCPLSVSPRCQCVYTIAGQTPAPSPEFRKITTF